MTDAATAHEIEIPERLRPVHQALRRALKKAFLSGQAYDPDGKGYAYWKAQDDAEKAGPSGSPPSHEK